MVWPLFLRNQPRSQFQTPNLRAKKFGQLEYQERLE
jgi:hypothetical protein